MFKRCFAVIFSLVLIIFTAGGCLQAPNQGKPGGKAPAVVSVWYSLTADEEKELLKQFERINLEHPEVLVKGKYVPEKEFVDLVWKVQAGGEGPEIFIARRQIIYDLYKKGALSPVLARNYSAFIPAKAVFTFNNQLFAVPWLTDVPLLYYRTDKISKAPESLTELFDQKAVIGIPGIDTALLSPWWKAEGGSLILDGAPSLDSPVNSAFLEKLLYLKSQGIVTFDSHALSRFIRGEINYLLSWASHAPVLDRYKVSWSSVSLSTLLGDNGRALLDNTVGIANSSIKSVPGMEEAIRIVEEELLKAEVQSAMQEAGRRLPVNEKCYSFQTGSYQAETARVLRSAWVLGGASPEWRLVPLQNATWQNILAGSDLESELAKAQQQAAELWKKSK